MAWGKKKDQPKKVPYRKCGVGYKTKKMPNGSTVTLYCTRNGNKPHTFHSNNRTD